MLTQRFGTNNIGGLLQRCDDVHLLGRPWRWVAWRREERAEGVADDRTNASSALWHFLDPLETCLSDEDARA